MSKPSAAKEQRRVALENVLADLVCANEAVSRLVLRIQQIDRRCTSAELRRVLIPCGLEMCDLAGALSDARVRLLDMIADTVGK
jgi:hypothetical protein